MSKKPKNRGLVIKVPTSFLLPDAPPPSKTCAVCGDEIAIMIFRGSGLCSVNCEKEWARRVEESKGLPTLDKVKSQ